MQRLGKEVDEVNRPQNIARIQQAQRVASEAIRITGNIEDHCGIQRRQMVKSITHKATTRRVKHHQVDGIR